MKRAAESLRGNYTSSVLPDRRRLTDTLPNLQGSVGEARGKARRDAETATGLISFIFVTTETHRCMTNGCPGPVWTRAEAKDKGQAQLQRHDKQLQLVIVASPSPTSTANPESTQGEPAREGILKRAFSQ